MTAAAALGYRLTLPSGWYRIPTGEQSQEAIDRFIDNVGRGFSGAEAVRVRREWEERLPRLVAEAESSGALDLYVFGERVHGAMVTMNFVVSVVFLGAVAADWGDDELEQVAVPEGASHEFLDAAAGRVLRVEEHLERSLTDVREQVAEQLGEDASMADVEAAGGEAAEAVEAIREAEARGAMVRFARVSHLVAIPDAAGAFLMISTELPQTELTAAKLGHIDLVASTLEWRR